MIDDTTADRLDSLGPVGTVWLGLRLIVSELEWAALNGLRNMEIRQMERRLRQEHEHLERLLHADAPPPPDGEVDLTRRQIEFLEEEIDYLRHELGARRKEFVERRLAALTGKKGAKCA